MPSETGLPSAIEEIITGLADDNNPLSSAKLAELTDIKPEHLALFDEIWKHVNLKRQLQILGRLIEMAEDSTEFNFDAILKHRLHDPEEEIRSSAINGLWENEEPSLIQPLINILRNDPSSKVRQNAAIALGRFSILAEHKKINSDYTPILCKSLLDAFHKAEDLDIKRRALEAAAPLSIPQVEKAITQAYQGSEIKLKASAIYAMGRNCSIDWLNLCIKELSNPIAELRYEAAGACGELGEDIATPYLIKLVNDDDMDVRMAAIQALGKIGDSEAKEQLKLCLGDDSEAIREAAQQALDEIDTFSDPGSISWLDAGEPE